MSETDLPDRARVVIIGGGVGGASIAYHLTELGWTDVVVLDRDDLTSGSTFHSAGLVGQLRSTVTLTRMMMHSIEVYRRLATETDGMVDPHFAEVGSLRLASSPERLEELRRQAGWAATFGLPLELIGRDETLDRFPLIDPTEVLGSVFLPTDGWLDPSNLCRALARVARTRGAAVHTHTRVVGIDTEPVRTASGSAGRAVTAVRTDRGTIACEVVVNAGGMFAWELGQLAGVEVPVVPFAHQYVLLRLPGVEVPLDLPTMRDPDRLVYFRRGRGRADHGRLRTGPRAVVPAGGPGRLQQQAPGVRLGPLPAPVGQRGLDRPRRRRGGGGARHQRTRGVHPGRRVHPG